MIKLPFLNSNVHGKYGPCFYFSHFSLKSASSWGFPCISQLQMLGFFLAFFIFLHSKLWLRHLTAWAKQGKEKEAVKYCNIWVMRTQQCTRYSIVYLGKIKILFDQLAGGTRHPRIHNYQWGLLNTLYKKLFSKKTNVAIMFTYTVFKTGIKRDNLFNS